MKDERNQIKKIKIKKLILYITLSGLLSDLQKKLKKHLEDLSFNAQMEETLSYVNVKEIQFLIMEMELQIELVRELATSLLD